MILWYSHVNGTLLQCILYNTQLCHHSIKLHLPVTAHSLLVLSCCFTLQYVYYTVMLICRWRLRFTMRVGPWSGWLQQFSVSWLGSVLHGFPLSSMTSRMWCTPAPLMERSLVSTNGCDPSSSSSNELITAFCETINYILALSVSLTFLCFNIITWLRVGDYSTCNTWQCNYALILYYNCS